MAHPHSTASAAPRDPARLAQLKEQWSEYQRLHALKTTSQRELIVDVFLRGTQHVSIEELLTEVRRHSAKVGYATVYRTLKLLAECGVANEQRFGEGVTRYEIANEEHHHDHLICLECGRIEEFEEPAIEELQEQIALRHGYEVRSHKHELYGLCPDCRRRRDGGRAKPSA